MKKLHDKTICLHLLPFLTALEVQGSQIFGINENLWSNCLLNVMLDKGPDMAQSEKMFVVPNGVKLWHNNDTHYAIEMGLFCEPCKHSLSWPGN